MVGNFQKKSIINHFRNLVNAIQVLAKHDEKYVPPEVADAMKENHKGPASAYVGNDKGNDRS